ncbi:permease prefix domain 1-containing protein [Microbacterium sp. CIAB417]|uniref:permease prefix domain 1-containing protein n=1 Tax=Microbacterium sp. CIAB417 TaxID=2860287 RepID=UPI001FAC41DD|nr:permease prefix domain 1-containing protein [Microbacterium sp. CIAB417]
MTATLTERYISATIRSLTPETQGDVRAELEASIADAVEARVEQGEDPAEAERAVLTELGDPGILAAGYADRSLHLIGPKYYLTWWRLLKLLLWIVPVSVVGALVLGLLLSGAGVGETIGQAVSVGITVMVHIGFWTTLVFAVLERTGADTGAKWDVDQLPEIQEDGAGRSELIASLVFLGIAVVAVIWDRVRGFFPTGGEPIPILDPALWPWWIGALFVLIAFEAVFAVVIFRRGWTTALAVVNTVLALAFAAWVLIPLISGDLINPEFLAHIVQAGGEGFAAGDAEAAGNGGIFRILAVLVGFGIGAGVIWDIIDGWRKARRAVRA